jgi:mRNA interferase MazF
MVKLRSVVRGEIWLTELDPTIGSEIRKTRPCLVVSPDGMNRFLRTVTAVPLTSGSSPARFRPALKFKNKSGYLLADQMRSLDRARFVKRVGVVDKATLDELLGILREMFEP